ncbi:hypothetical protein DIZ27_44805 [Streptomyces sp. NWU339]|nr:hypothetical protein DIZ27_44805 [Streptomyces sp. NWU339]
MSLRSRSGERVPSLTAQIARASNPGGTTAGDGTHHCGVPPGKGLTTSLPAVTPFPPTSHRLTAVPHRHIGNLGGNPP